MPRKLKPPPLRKKKIPLPIIYCSHQFIESRIHSIVIFILKQKSLYLQSHYTLQANPINVFSGDG